MILRFTLNIPHLSNYISRLAWEPSVAQASHNYFHRLLDFGLKLRFDPLNLKSQNQAKNIPMGFPRSQTKK